MSKDTNYGRIVAGRYQLDELVGEGAMGKVYRAHDKLLGGVIVAVKFLSQTLLSQKMRERFEREATISAILGEQSIHIVRVRDYGIDEQGIPFYVMEFLKGESLSDTIHYEPLPLIRFLKVTRQICLALETAHKGILFNNELCTIIHRDIKPGNILVLQDPTLGELVKILDFGIAKLIQSGGAQTQSFMGTLAYCSPEQMEGKELDNRSDIYSLGVMMYEMLTCEMPILPESSSFGAWYKAHHEFSPQPFETNLNLPEPLQKLVMRCLAKSPSDRPQTVSEIFPVLDSLLKTHNKSLQDKTQIIEHQPQLPQSKTSTPNSGSSNPSVPSRSSIELACWQSSWPKDKPVQKIVFPYVLTTPKQIIPCLYVMLDFQEILHLRSSIRYNQFLFLGNPHPMLLWVTLLYNPEQEPRWLPCYLDLKTPKAQQIARILAESSAYHLLFFAINEPERCQNVMVSSIAANNCKLLKDWSNSSQLVRPSGSVQTTKNLLKQELDNIKPKILLKLQSVRTKHLTDISGGN